MEDFANSITLEMAENGPGIFKIAPSTCDRQWLKLERRAASESRPIRVAILAASFNPPTIAHSTLLEEALKVKPLGDDTMTSDDAQEEDADGLTFDASLLIFAMNNPDKPLTGATVGDRVQMMDALAETVARKAAVPLATVGVGVTDGGIFFDKARILRSFFTLRGMPNVFLYFIMGYDTVTRFFDPKYYKDDMVQEMERFFHHSRIICASRGGTENGHDPLKEWLVKASSENPLVQQFRRYILQIPDWSANASTVASLSSTMARSLMHGYWVSERDDEKDAIYDELKRVVPESILSYMKKRRLYVQ
ncbi:hypothetical protein BC832DRAFT_594786 [Gaertneriomyces semiglobifer]|nr:hypothetical protein BC832DRAFT_594786 [Gaertneriomyces semiglobifer]